MKRRSTFRRRDHKNHGSNVHVFAQRGWNSTLAHYALLHNPKRERSESELETMRRAAQRRPHGFSAMFLALTDKPATQAPARKSRAKKVAA